jgi:cytosine/adenosine deaminase-related metal-dependent hydrolase
VIRTGGTIYPGLIELHNHLSYDVLTLWDVPRLFTNRGQWKAHPDKKQLITAPMRVLGTDPHYVPAIVRYVEVKALLGGTTTSQGITLFSNNGIKKFYRGVVRNVEKTNEEELPKALAKIPDIDADDAQRFLQRLRDSTSMLLHLSEGLDDTARRHFLALHLGGDQWAITEALAGIHSAGLIEEDFVVMAERGASMVWSPFSNYLLYGGTADVAAAHRARVKIGLGSDWSPTGSKNLLGELKAARVAADLLGGVFTDRELVVMATIEAARIIQWDDAIGSIEPGKRADLMVMRGRSGDPYRRLIEARETSVVLDVINGVARAGQPRLMGQLGATTEELHIGCSRRALNLAQQTADPLVEALTLAEARTRLIEGLSRVPQLAARLEAPDGAAAAFRAPGAAEMWVLDLEQDESTGDSLRHTLRMPGDVAAPPSRREAAVALAEPVSVPLDPLTAVEDRTFHRRIRAQANLPEEFVEGLLALY